MEAPIYLAPPSPFNNQYFQSDQAGWELQGAEVPGLCEKDWWCTCFLQGRNGYQAGTNAWHQIDLVQEDGLSCPVVIWEDGEIILPKAD